MWLSCESGTDLHVINKSGLSVVVEIDTGRRGDVPPTSPDIGGIVATLRSAGINLKRVVTHVAHS